MLQLSWHQSQDYLQLLSTSSAILSTHKGRQIRHGFALALRGLLIRTLSQESKARQSLKSSSLSVSTLEEQILSYRTVNLDALLLPLLLCFPIHKPKEISLTIIYIRIYKYFRRYLPLVLPSEKRRRQSPLLEAVSTTSNHLTSLPVQSTESIKAPLHSDLPHLMGESSDTSYLLRMEGNASWTVTKTGLQASFLFPPVGKSSVWRELLQPSMTLAAQSQPPELGSRHRCKIQVLWFTFPAEANAPSGLQICYRCLGLLVLQKVNLDTGEWILSLSFPIHQLANHCQKWITQIQDFFFPFV